MDVPLVVLQNGILKFDNKIGIIIITNAVRSYYRLISIAPLENMFHPEVGWVNRFKKQTVF